MTASRPTSRGTQVISARLPTALAEELLADAGRLGVRLSDLVRDAVDSYLHASHGHVAGVAVSASRNIRVPVGQGPVTENPNLIVQPEAVLIVSAGTPDLAAAGDGAS